MNSTKNSQQARRAILTRTPLHYALRTCQFENQGGGGTAGGAGVRDGDAVARATASGFGASVAAGVDCGESVKAVEGVPVE